MAPTPEETLALLMDPLIRHPISRHSFAPSHTVAGAVCHGCGQRIVALRDHRCLLCGVAAHRRCLYALSEKCKTDASLKCTSDGSHIPPPEPPSGRLDATSSPAAVLNVAVKQPLDRLWRSATRAAETKPPAARRRAARSRLREGRGAPVGSVWRRRRRLGPRRRAAAGARAGAGADALPPPATPDTGASRASGGALPRGVGRGSELRLRAAPPAAPAAGRRARRPAPRRRPARASSSVAGGAGAVVGGRSASTRRDGRRGARARRRSSAADRRRREAELLPRRRPPRARRTPRPAARARPGAGRRHAARRRGPRRAGAGLCELCAGSRPRDGEGVGGAR